MASYNKKALIPPRPKRLSAFNLFLKERLDLEKKDLYPPRPKRPVSAYNLFLKDWVELEKKDVPAEGQQPLGPKEVLREAALAWSALDPTSRAVFTPEVDEDRLRFNTEMNVWREEMKALKRPASSYGLFLVDFWKRKASKGQTFKKMSKMAAREWGKMDANARKPYEDTYANNLERYFEEWESVRDAMPSGEELDKWLNEEEDVDMDADMDVDMDKDEAEIDETEEGEEDAAEVEDSDDELEIQQG